MAQGVKKEEFEKSQPGEIADVAHQPPNFRENCTQAGEIAGVARQRPNLRRILINTLRKFKPSFARWEAQRARACLVQIFKSKKMNFSRVFHPTAHPCPFLFDIPSH
ncbi:hypothetical protein HAX54_022352, partial [Datura stramonium]|nr:hypothetical protein [Datura stramonium]